MSERVVSLFMELMIKPGLVFGLAIAIASLMERQSASLRHRVLTVSFVAALALPVVRTAIPTLPLRVLATTSAPIRGVGLKLPSDKLTIAAHSQLPISTPSLLRERSRARAPSPDWTIYVASLWAIGALALLVRLIVAH